MNFITHRIGQGFFIRTDAGAARLGVDVSGIGDSSSKWGYGGLLGIGYGFPITAGTRILLNANYSHRQVEGESYGSVQISIGGLF